MNFVRNFVSVGQGGFSIEKFYHEDKMVFCMVYDCGSSSFKYKKMKKKIREHFDTNDKINALFISHFDDDHINGISILLEQYCVDKIFLPILSKSEKILLNASMTDKKILSFINGPVNYIYNIISKNQNNNKISIVFVRNTNIDNNEFDEEEPKNDNIKISYINSGDAISFQELNNNSEFDNKNIWEYIPYNVSFNAYNDLIKEIKKAFGTQHFKNILKNSNKRSELIKIYKDILKKYEIPSKDDTNQNNLNSLILYSGPTQNNRINVKLARFCNDFFKYKYDNICNYRYWDCGISSRCCRCFDYSRLFENKVGCMYFGDSDAKDKNVIAILKKHIKGLSFVQLPHHGSEYNNDDNILNNYLVFIIFSGTKNNYNHPSEKVIERLNILGKLYFIVTEHREDELLVIYDLRS